MRTSNNSSLAESPWLWAIVFTVVAQIVIVGIGAKYNLRQRQLDRQFVARENLMRAAPGSSATAIEPASGQQPRITLWPLQAFLGFVGVGAAAMLWRERRACSQYDQPAATSERAAS